MAYHPENIQVKENSKVKFSLNRSVTQFDFRDYL